MRVFPFDPVSDPRWLALVEANSSASIFHTPAWLEALRRTYGYRPIGFTTCAPGGLLRHGAIFCGIGSWATGDRLVSLPFSDHCQPLLDGSIPLDMFCDTIRETAGGGKWKYIELRPITSSHRTDSLERAALSYAWHTLDLRPGPELLMRSFHKSCIQRKICRAERERFLYEEGCSEHLLDAFYHLMIQTRRRQGVPPQPKQWFRNLMECLGGAATIQILSKGSKPAAAMLTLAFKQTLTYKYGCSDEQFHRLGVMPLLFWEVIQRANASGFEEFDLGRSDLDNQGLIQFKNHLGARASIITYQRFPCGSVSNPLNSYAGKAISSALRRLPSWSLPVIGNLIYKHFG